MKARVGHNYTFTRPKWEGGWKAGLNLAASFRQNREFLQGLKVYHRNAVSSRSITPCLGERIGDSKKQLRIRKRDFTKNRVGVSWVSTEDPQGLLIL